MKKLSLEEKISQILPLFEEEELPPRTVRKEHYFINLPKVGLILEELYNSGYSTKFLGKFFKMNSEKISKVLKKRGLRIKFDKRRDVTDFKTLELFLQGNSIKKISELLICSIPTVRLRLLKHYQNLNEAKKIIYREMKKLRPDSLAYYRSIGQTLIELAKKFKVSVPIIESVMEKDKSARKYCFPYDEGGNINEFLLNEMLKHRVKARKICFNFRVSFNFLSQYAKNKRYNLNLKGFSLKQEKEKKERIKKKKKREIKNSKNFSNIIYWREKGLTIEEISDKLGICVKSRIKTCPDLASKVCIELPDGTYNLPLLRKMYDNQVSLSKMRYIARIKRIELINSLRNLGLPVDDNSFSKRYSGRRDIRSEDVKKSYERIKNRTELARIYSTTVKTITNRLIEAGVELEKRAHRPDVKDTEIIKMKREGISTPQIASYFEISESSIRHRLKKYSEYPSLIKTNPQRKDIVPEQVRREYEQTGDIDQIAKSYNVSRATIIRRLKKAGVTKFYVRTDIKDEEIIKLRKQGMSFDKIENGTGLSSI